MQLGDDCANPGAAKLLSNREIPMMDFNLTLTGQDNNSAGLGSIVNSLGIGTTCPNMVGRLTVYEKDPVTLTVPNSHGVYSQNYDVLGVNGVDETGVTGEARGLQINPRPKNYGGKFYAEGATEDFGVYGKADGTVTGTLGAGYGGVFEAANGFATSVGVAGISQSSATTGVGVSGASFNSAQTNTGVSAVAAGTTTFTNRGLIARSGGSSVLNYGGDFNTTNTSTLFNYAVIAKADNASIINCGVSGIANGPATSINFGIFGQATPVGPNSYAGFFQGDVFINGPTFATTIGYISDQQFKIDVDSITNSLSIIKNLKPRSYYMDTAGAGNTYGFNFSSKRQLGFIAQDVEQILPELIIPGHKPEVYDTLGNIVTPSVVFKSLNYIGFISLLTKGIQEQSKTIDSLRTNNANMQDQLNQLSQMINDCCSANRSHGSNINNNNSNSTTSTNVKLTDSQAIVLDNAVPNPFAEQTTINYFLPDDVGKAQMLFYNAGGKLIQSVELTQRGQGQLNVFAQDLTNGLYTYTLVVDGKIFETKKMVKQ